MHEPAPPRLHSPAAERNRQPILEVLQQVLPPAGRALEIACGTGQHAVHFAAALPGWHWQPTDPDAAALASTAAWRADAALPNLAAPRRFDLLADRWPLAEDAGPLDLVFVSNLLHISPWATCAALFQGAATALAAHGVVVVYGPFLVRDVPTAPGNVAFDGDLRQRNPAWGLRWLHDVVAVAAAAGFAEPQVIDMPANNRTLVFRRRPDAEAPG